MIISPVFVGLPLLLYILVKKINIEIVITHRSIRAPIMNWSEDKKIRRSLQPQIYEIDFIQIQRIEFIDYMGLPRDNMSHSIVLYLDDGDIKYIVTKGLLRSQRKRIYLYLNEYISNLTSLSM